MHAIYTKNNTGIVISMYCGDKIGMNFNIVDNMISKLKFVSEKSTASLFLQYLLRIKSYITFVFVVGLVCLNEPEN